MIDIVSLYSELACLPTAEQQQRLQPLRQDYPEQVLTLEKMLSIDDTPLSSSQLIAQQYANHCHFKHEELIGQQVMGFTIIELVSNTGGMGLVFLGEQRLANQQSSNVKIHKAAIKIIRSNSLNSQQQKAVFFNEASILMTLDHPNVCSIYGVSEVLGHACIVMDFIDGQGLDVWLANNKLNRIQKLNVFEQLLGAVSYLHRQHFFHGDLKPQNIIINDQGHLVLIDLGLARKYSRKINGQDIDEQLFVPAFSRNWSAPEQVAGHACTAQSDVFSLGVILHFLLTGSVMTNDKIPMLKNTELNSIINKALSNQPQQRYSNADLFRQSINFYQQGMPVAEYSQRGTYHLHKLVKRKPFTSLTCVLLAYSVAASMWIVFH